MKTQTHRLEKSRQRRFEADLECTVEALFRRWPILCGFSIRETARPARDPRALRHVSELLLTDVSVYPFCDLVPPVELCEEIVSALATMLDERPEICELLRGRAFARVFH